MAAICVWISTFPSVRVPFVRFPLIIPPHKSFLSGTSHYNLGAVVRIPTRAPFFTEVKPANCFSGSENLHTRGNRRAGMIIWIRLSTLVLTPRREGFRGPGP
jgi:hypothetical protein